MSEEMLTVQALKPLEFPLWGSRLIEASAGTGKTYTIAALYLRLVLQHGGANAYQRPLVPPDPRVGGDPRARRGRRSGRGRLVVPAS